MLRVKRGLARIGIRLVGDAQDGSLPKTADFDQDVFNLADALENVRDAPRGTFRVNAQIVISNKTTDIETHDNGIRDIRLLINPQSTHLAKDVQKFALEVLTQQMQIKTKLRNLKRVGHNWSAFFSNPNSYLDWLERFLKDLEDDSMDGNLLKHVTEIEITDGSRITGDASRAINDNGIGLWIDGTLNKDVTLNIPMGAPVKPNLIKTAMLEIRADGMLSMFSYYSTRWTGRKDDSIFNNGGAERADYDNTLEKTIDSLATALTNKDGYSGDNPDMSRIGRVHFAPPGTKTRTETVTIDDKSLIDIHVPVDTRAPLNSIINALHPPAGRAPSRQWPFPLSLFMPSRNP